MAGEYMVADLHDEVTEPLDGGGDPLCDDVMGQVGRVLQAESDVVDPSVAHITPPHEYTYLFTLWQGGPVLGGDIVSWPLEVAPAGPFPAGTGTISNPFNGMCVALAGDGATVVAWKCSPGAASQQWTGYNDGTLRINGKCLDVTGTKAGATVKVAACTGATTQAWAIGQVSANDFGPIANKATGYVLTDPARNAVNGTRLIIQQGRGDLSYPWRVSYHHYVPY